MEILNREQQIAQNKVHLLSHDKQNAIKKGTVHFGDQSFYIRTSISGTMSELFGTNAPDATVGVTNIDKGRMPEDFVCGRITLEFGSHATETNPAKINYTNVFDADGLDAAVANGELEIMVDGERFLSMPCKKFFSIGGAGMVDGKGTLEFELGAPRLIQKGQRIEVRFRAADGASYSVANNFMACTFSGTIITK